MIYGLIDIHITEEIGFTITIIGTIGQYIQQTIIIQIIGIFKTIGTTITGVLIVIHIIQTIGIITIGI